MLNIGMYLFYFTGFLLLGMQCGWKVGLAAFVLCEYVFATINALFSSSLNAQRDMIRQERQMFLDLLSGVSSTQRDSADVQVSNESNPK